VSSCGVLSHQSAEQIATSIASSCVFTTCQAHLLSFSPYVISTSCGVACPAGARTSVTPGWLTLLLLLVLLLLLLSMLLLLLLLVMYRLNLPASKSTAWWQFDRQVWSARSSTGTIPTSLLPEADCCTLLSDWLSNAAAEPPLLVLLLPLLRVVASRAAEEAPCRSKHPHHRF
jgi:hypothetical protein